MFANADAAEMKKQKDHNTSDGLASERQENQSQHAHDSAHPKALDSEVVHIGAALDRRPEKALEATFRSNGGIRKS